MGRFFTRRCICLHVVTLLLVSSFVLATWWQYESARGGNALSWAYVFEWPAFAIYAIYMWWQLIHDRHTAFDKLWAAKQHAAADASGMPLYEIPGWALDKTLYREVVDASLEAANSPALSVGQTRSFTTPELGDGHSSEGDRMTHPQIDEWVDDRAEDGASPVIDARVVDVKVHVDEELNAYNRYLGELSWRDPPKHWGTGRSWGRRGTAKVSGAPVPPPADSIDAQRSELPAAEPDAASEDELDRR
jgi:hypothetical protein